MRTGNKLVSGNEGTRAPHRKSIGLWLRGLRVQSPSLTLFSGNDRTNEVAERFLSLIDRSGGPAACWPWTGPDNGVGYGVFCFGGRSALAHRLVYEAVKGPIPEGLFLRHKVCGNPPCCNPAHLEPGTQKQNMADMIAMGRACFGERQWMSKLTDESALDILKRRAAGERAKDLASEYGVSRPLITLLCQRKIWRHLDGPETRRKRGGRRLLRADRLALAVAIVKAAGVTP